MKQHAESRLLPKNVSAFKDRHGRVRYRFRKTGYPTIYFRTVPDESELAECLVGVKFAGKAASQPLPDHSVVYFIGAGVDYVKIGFTANLKSRLNDLRCASATPLDLLAFTPGGANMERAFHKLFAKARHRGEWFKRSPELDLLIEELATAQKRSQL